jgi:hypothetical protein
VETVVQVQKTETDAVRARVERAERALEHERKGKNRIEKQLAEAMGVNQAGAAALEEVSVGLCLFVRVFVFWEGIG